MATLLLERVNDQVVTIRDQGWEDLGENEALWQEVLEFGRHHPTFHLDWEHNKLTREEMNEG